MLRARLKWGAVLAILAVAIAAELAWSTWSREVPLYRDEARSRQAVLEHVPLGTDLRTARARMEDDGFRCQGVEYPPGEEALRCSRDRLVRFVGWTILLEAMDSTVTEVRVAYAATLP